jgi:two-component system phosphate regulon sensor histidine kinase PhoR
LSNDASPETLVVAEAINKLAARAATDIDDLRRLERVRSEFIANVSHELRTPIFSVQGYLETLLDGAADDPAVSQQFLEKAYNNALRLNVLLNDLIDISRIESGELKFSFRSFDLCGLIRDLVEELHIRAEQQQVELSATLPDEAYVYGDRERISQVLVNLVENAIKYNVTNGRVDVIVEPDSERWMITVRDTGIGIPEEHLPRIFERFYRVDKDRSRAVGVTGLGLAIVKHICEAHRSSVAITSTPNAGTEISFTLAQG